MQIVIDIPEVFYEALKKTGEIVSGQRSGKTLMSVIYSAVANGTPLPKGHGALKDYHGIRSEYIRKMSITMSTEFRMMLLCGIIDDAPIVVEADREVDNEKAE